MLNALPSSTSDEAPGDDAPTDNEVAELMGSVRRVILERRGWDDETRTAARTFNAALAKRLSREPG